MTGSDANLGPSGGALNAPAVARNRDAILAVLRRVLPARGLVLEIASGTGEHAVHVASAMPGLTWQPSDRDPESLASIRAHRRASSAPNLLDPVELDAAEAVWPIGRADAIVAINMIHISPWGSAQGLFAGASQILADGGPVYLYGPFEEPDRPMAPSNLAFDRGLRERNAAWGIRRLDAVRELARQHGFELSERIEMPANNLSIVFRR